MRNKMFHFVDFPSMLVPISAFIATLFAEDKRKVTLKTDPQMALKWKCTPELQCT